MRPKLRSRSVPAPGQAPLVAPNAAALLRANASDAGIGSRPAIRFGDRVWTHREYFDESVRFANLFLERLPAGAPPHVAVLLDNSPDYLKRVFDVNLHGAWFMSRAVTPTMCEKRWGRIINQSSGAAYIYLMPPEERFRELGAFTYSQTKWGLVGLTKFMAGQLGQYNVLVNCIAPGVTMTEATKKIVPEEFMGMVTMMSAMKRTLEPEDLAGTAVFFASDDANFVTGQVLCVDGGACMPA